MWLCYILVYYICTHLWEFTFYEVNFSAYLWIWTLKISPPLWEQGQTSQATQGSGGLQGQILRHGAFKGQQLVSQASQEAFGSISGLSCSLLFGCCLREAELSEFLLLGFITWGERENNRKQKGNWPLHATSYHTSAFHCKFFCNGSFSVHAVLTGSWRSLTHVTRFVVSRSPIFPQPLPPALVVLRTPGRLESKQLEFKNMKWTSMSADCLFDPDFFCSFHPRILDLAVVQWHSGTQWYHVDPCGVPILAQRSFSVSVSFNEAPAKPPSGQDFGHLPTSSDIGYEVHNILVAAGKNWVIPPVVSCVSSTVFLRHPWSPILIPLSLRHGRTHAEPSHLRPL